jgi:iron-sulfur cluster repair protein YtfE (RIC family)
MSTDTVTRVRADMTVNEAIQHYPATLPVFQEAGIDACCGGGRRIGDVATRHRIDLAALLEQLNQAAGTRSGSI